MSIFLTIMVLLYAAGAAFWAIQFTRNFSGYTEGETTRMKIVYVTIMAAFVVTWPVAFAILLMLVPVIWGISEWSAGRVSRA